MVVAGGSTAQSLEAQQKNGVGVNKGNGIQLEDSQGVPPLPPDLTMSLQVPYSFTPFFALPLLSDTTLNLQVQNSE